MTANEKRNTVIKQYKKILGRNIYSQNVTKRECVYNPYKNGKYYSDCSSSVRWAYKMANIGLNYIGGNTCGIYSSKDGKEVDVDIKNGLPTDISKLRIGDCFLFAGTDKNRAEWNYTGHIEMIYSIKGNKVTLCGHGSGNPHLKDMKDYCTSRYKSKTNTKLGNKGLIKIVRFIEDDEKAITPVKPNDNKDTDTLYEVYTVKSGDSINKISKLFGTSTYNLIVWNKIRNVNIIDIGQKLKVFEYKIYTVKRGDTLSKISKDLLGNSKKYKDIMTLNSLKNTNINIGQKLKIRL